MYLLKRSLAGRAGVVIAMVNILRDNRRIHD